LGQRASRSDIRWPAYSLDCRRLRSFSFDCSNSPRADAYLPLRIWDRWLHFRSQHGAAGKADPFAISPI